MSTLVFRLRNVPDDEAQAIRELMDEHKIDWFETTTGNWGIAMPGLWIVNDEQVHTTRQLIDQYQAERGATQRELHEQQRQLGNVTTLSQRLLEHPLQSIGIILFCLFILYVSIHPFMQMIEFARQ